MSESEKEMKKAAKRAAKAEKQLAKANAKAAAKEHASKKGLIAVLLMGAAAATTYFFWKRSQPVEDPWAEAYWEDIADFDAAAPDSVETPADSPEDEAKACCSQAE